MENDGENNDNRRFQADKHAEKKEQTLSTLSREQLVDLVQILNTACRCYEEENMNLKTAAMERDIYRILFPEPAYFLLDTGAHIIDAGEKACRILDSEASRIRGKAITDFMYKWSREIFMQFFSDTCQRGEKNTFVADLIGEGDQHIYARVICDPVRDSENKTIACRMVMFEKGGFRNWIRSLNEIFEDLTGMTRKEYQDAEFEEEIKRIGQRLMHSEKKRKELYRQLQNAQEEERKRISRELHDSIGSGLSAVKLGLETKLTEPYFDPNNGTRIENVVKILKGVMQETKRMSTKMYPSVIEMLGICPAIRSFCQDIRNVYPDTDISFDVQADENIVENGKKLMIYRIAQETINNALKHSKCDRIEVRLRSYDDRIELLVWDNGNGFDFNQIKNAEKVAGTGLLSIKERVEIEGGRFEIDSLPRHGVSVKVSLPAP